MITRDIFGKIRLSVGNYIVSETHNGKWEILKREPYYTTTAVLKNEVLMWLDLEPFESKVQAYAWLKKHVNELL